MTSIKLLKINVLNDGTQRFQSQLFVGRIFADFIMGNDGIMKCYGTSNNGLDYYEYKGKYEIVSNKSDMVIQEF